MIIDLAGWRAAQTPDRPAARWRGDWLTYAELDQRATRLAARLHAEGVRRGDRVGILALNHIAHLDLLLAAPKLGFIYTPFNYRLSAAEQKDLAQSIEPKLVMHDRANELKAEALGGRLLPLARYADWLKKRAAAVAPPELTADDIHMILFTGGSTGVPKGALIPYRQVHDNAINTVSAWGLTADDCAIQATPAFHAALNVLTTPLLHVGGRVDWMETFDAGDYLDRAAGDATILFMVPSMFQALADHPAFATADLSRVRFAITGGAPCPPALRERFAARGIRFRLGFGMTECGVNCFTISSDDAERHPDSVGRPMPGLRAVIRRPDGKEVARGDVGELTLSGPVVCSGYFRRPEETAEALRDGWLWTGDLAHQDKDGLFYICGRRKEMYISGGENVYPAEVEAALSQCRGVVECAVVGIPHPRWGETGLAAVTLKRGAKQSADNLRTELKARLAGYKVPSEFMFLKALPKTGAGKINKPGIRALYDGQGAISVAGRH